MRVEGRGDVTLELPFLGAGTGIKTFPGVGTVTSAGGEVAAGTAGGKRKCSSLAATAAQGCWSGFRGRPTARPPCCWPPPLSAGRTAKGELASRHKLLLLGCTVCTFLHREGGLPWARSLLGLAPLLPQPREVLLPIGFFSEHNAADSSAFLWLYVQTTRFPLLELV